MSTTSGNENRTPYEPPQVKTYSSTEILTQLGPARAIYGTIP